MAMVMKKTATTTRTIGAGEFKTHCLRLLDEVHDKRVRLVITKRGKPVAVLEPPESPATSIFGTMKGTGRIIGDIIEPVDVEWEADIPNLFPDERKRD